MRKIVFIMVFLLIAGAVFGQDYTFQGLPWGASKEQVIAKFGRPIEGYSYNNIFIYDVSLSGFLCRLDIGFDDSGMCSASYDVGRYQRLSIDQLRAAFVIITGQLVEKYGPYHEIISPSPVIMNNEERELVWHFNNYNIIVNTITNNSNSLNVSYCSDLSWRAIEEEITAQKMIRFPNGDL
jgi:hypothetical protein